MSLLISTETLLTNLLSEFKLRGYPFLATGTDTVETRMLFLRILDILAQNNFVVYASIDQSVGSGGESQGATLLFLPQPSSSFYCRRDRQPLYQVFVNL